MGAAATYLEGLVVLDLSSVGPAARASRILADYAATVVKVAPVAAKRAKQTEPPYFGYGAGRGMKRLRVDLEAAAGKSAFLRLAAGADVVIESFRPGVAARLGVGYDQVRALNERVIYCSTSGYGQDGPYSGWAGHDLNYLALGGYLHCSGRRSDGAPAIPGATVADGAAGGMHAVIAILAALAQRDKTGKGDYLDVSVAEGVLQLMSLHVDRYLATGDEPGPGSDILTGRYACYDLYPARDGRWLAVAAIEPAFYANLCRALGCETWLEHQFDDGCQDEIRAAFCAAFARRDRDRWIATLASADTCVAPVYSIAELAEDEHLLARGVFAEAEHGQWGRFRQVGAVLAGTRRRQLRHTVRDAAETDTDELLRAAGIDDEELAALHRTGVVE